MLDSTIEGVSMSMRKWYLLLAYVSCASALVSAHCALAQSPNDFIKVSVTCAAELDNVLFSFSFENIGSSDTSMLLGDIVGNGRRYQVSLVAAEVRDGSGTTTYTYQDPSLPGIAGRVDPWVLMLPTGSRFEFERPASHFWSNGTQLTRKTVPYELRISMTAHPIPDHFAIPNFNAFVGDLQSEWIKVSNDCGPK